MSHYHPAAASIEFNVHGRVGLRVLDASAKQASKIGRRVGVPSGTLDGTPDLVVRFVDARRMEALALETVVGDACFASDGRVGWRDARTGRVEATLALAGSARPTEILCHQQCRDIPLLEPLLHLHAIARGVVPLHASAFRSDGQTAAIVGWAGGGKTGILLGMLAAGAEFISDDRVYVDVETDQLFGFRLPVGVRHSYLKQRPAWNKCVPLRRRFAARTTVAAQQILVSSRAEAWLSAVGLHRGARLVARFCASEPKVVFKPQDLSQIATIKGSAELHKVIFSVPWDRPETDVHCISIDDAVERIVQSSWAELRPLQACYAWMRFACPGLSNPALDGCLGTLRDLARQMLDGKEIYAIRHSRPVSLEAIQRQLGPLFRMQAKEEQAGAERTVQSDTLTSSRGKSHAISSYT